MARKLKTFTTSAGFFDLAVAAPSMKAALQAWDAGRNLFRDGFAKVSDDPDAVAATLSRPGVVLRRPVGSDASYSEHPALPKSLPAGKRKRPAKTAAPGGRTQRKSAPRKERVRKSEEARRDRAIAAAHTALESARRAHQARIADIEKDWAALERRLKSEEVRWRKKKRDLETAVRRAHL